MPRRRYRIPSGSALVAFESAARHCNFSRAAEELSTSQPAISRHIAALESRLNTRLFERLKKRLQLTEAGTLYYRAVVSALDGLQSASGAIEYLNSADQLTIACTHEISHLLLMPRFEALQAAVGDDIQIRITTCEYEALEATPDPRIDLMFSYQTLQRGADDQVVVFSEAVKPICSPDFADRHRDTLARGIDDWGQLPFLKLTKQNYGWTTWEEWFEHVGTPTNQPHYLWFDNYVYLLEAAAAGRGVALGWHGLIERHLASGTLQALSDQFTPFQRALYLQLTPRGKSRPAARRCLAFFRADGGSVDDTEATFMTGQQEAATPAGAHGLSSGLPMYNRAHPRAPGLAKPPKKDS